MSNALITYADAPTTVLSEYIDDNDTTLVVADASAFSATGVIVVSRASAYEIISYASKDDRHLYGLVRGDFGSVAVSHNPGETVALTTWTSSLSETDRVTITPSTHVDVSSLADFPTPVANVITLADETAYLITGTVDISPNRIVVGVKNTITGTDRQNDILMSDTTGVMFTMDNSVTQKTTLIFDNLTLKATAGTLISASGGATPAQVTFITTTITATPNGGTLSNVAFSMRTSSLSGFTTSGFVFSGANTALTFRDSSATNNVGTVFDCTSATFSVVRISRNSITASSGNTFLNATGTTITTAANLALNIFSGTSTHLVGVDENTAGWLFTANQGVTNTPTSVAWGDIVGTLADQVDLQAELDLKADTGDAPTAHEASHKSGGSDELLLNEFGSPTGSVQFNQQQGLQFRLENRTSDPSSPSVGEIWLRTDL